MRSSGTLSSTASIRLPGTVATEAPPTSGHSPYEALEFKTATSDHAEGEMIDTEACTQARNFAACLRASAPAAVPHTTSTFEIPVYLSGCQAVMSVNIYLPVLRCPPSSTSLLSITEYLTAFAWYPSSSLLLQAECRELLGSLARIAKDLTPMIRDEAMKGFLVLLSRLGQQVSTKKGIWVELCGLGKRKAVIRHQGNVQMIDIGRLATASAFN
jgi:hypothetical protein